MSHILTSVPVIYYWEEENVITAAFVWDGRKFGLSFPKKQNKIEKNIDRKKLIERVDATLDALLWHDKEVLDNTGNIDFEKLKDLEARRFFLDLKQQDRARWIIKNKSLKNITIDEARKLKLT